MSQSCAVVFQRTDGLSHSVGNYFCLFAQKPLQRRDMVTTTMFVITELHMLSSSTELFGTRLNKDSGSAILMSAFI